MPNRSINRVTFIGNLGDAPETTPVSGDSVVCNFPLALDDSYEKDGETRTTLVLDEEAVIKHGGGLIKSISFNESGRPKLKMYDAQKALEKILKAHGAYNHKQEHEHSGDLGIESKTLDDILSDVAERAERMGEEEDTEE